jgi:hypothetical protein
VKAYSHSGAVPVLGGLMTVAAGVLAAAILAPIYAYSFRYIPIIYLNVFITLAFGAGIGFAVAMAARWGKVRSNFFLGAIALLSTLLGLYLYWAAYLWALAGFDQVGPIALFPPVLVEFSQQLFENGSWGMKEGEPIKGWFLATIWLVESIVVLTLAMVVAFYDSERPFCETCNVWTDIEPGVARLASTGQEPEWQQVLAGDLPALASFDPAEPGSAQYVRLDAARCPRCEDTRFLTINAVQIVVDKNGQPSEKATPLVTNAIITPAQFAVIQACGQQYRQRLDEAVGADENAVETEGGGDAAPGQSATAEGEA